MHTARSRNDQVATDTRLYMMEAADSLCERIIALQETLLRKADDSMGEMMPGYTHLQKAQPILFSHHIMAYFWMLQRDFGRVCAAKDGADCLPLGSAALAGTTYDLDRNHVAQQLGFSSFSPNSMDAVSDRDFLLDMLYACATCILHLSRLCEELILWSTHEFGFITLTDEYSTGSSIMPQKRNPDFAELIRGKSGRVIGDLVALLTTMKALPLAYNKDMQEDKEPAFDAIDTLGSCLEVMTGMLSGMEVNADVMLKGTEGGFLDATDLADYLVGCGIPFRQAHEIVGSLVLACEKAGRRLAELEVSQIARAAGEAGVSPEVSGRIGDDVYDALDVRRIVARRTTPGGTGNAVVGEQIELAREALRLEREHIRPE
jgi:argininosuccinate lyase